MGADIIAMKFGWEYKRYILSLATYRKARRTPIPCYPPLKWETKRAHIFLKISLKEKVGLLMEH